MHLDPAPVAGMRPALGVAAVDEPVDDPGGGGGRDVEEPGHLGRAERVAAEVVQGGQLALAEPGPPGDDVAQQGAGVHEVAQRDRRLRRHPRLVHFCLTPLVAKLLSVPVENTPGV